MATIGTATPTGPTETKRLKIKLAKTTINWN